MSSLIYKLIRSGTVSYVFYIQYPLYEALFNNLFTSFSRNCIKVCTEDLYKIGTHYNLIDVLF